MKSMKKHNGLHSKPNIVEEVTPVFKWRLSAQRQSLWYKVGPKNQLYLGWNHSEKTRDFSHESFRPFIGVIYIYIWLHLQLDPGPTFLGNVPKIDPNPTDNSLTFKNFILPIWTISSWLVNQWSMKPSLRAYFWGEVHGPGWGRLGD